MKIQFNRIITIITLAATTGVLTRDRKSVV